MDVESINTYDYWALVIMSYKVFVLKISVQMYMVNKATSLVYYRSLNFRMRMYKRHMSLFLIG